MNEALLSAYLSLNAIIRNDRIVKDFTFREISVCHILYKAEKNNIKHITATLVVKETGMLKSQTNYVLNALLDKDYIKIVTNPKDKRQKLISFTQMGRRKYINEHKTIMKIMNYITSDMSSSEVEILCKNLNKISNKYNQIKGDKKWLE